MHRFFYVLVWEFFLVQVPRYGAADFRAKVMHGAQARLTNGNKHNQSYKDN